MKKLIVGSIDHESGESTPAFVEGDSVYVSAVDIWDF